MKLNIFQSLFIYVLLLFGIAACTFVYVGGDSKRMEVRTVEDKQVDIDSDKKLQTGGEKNGQQRNRGTETATGRKSNANPSSAGADVDDE